MLAQSFTVIASDNHDRVIVDAGFFQESNPMGDRRIGIGDFTVIEMIFVFLREWRRRFVRIMRIVQMYPHKVWAGAVFLKPTFSVADDFHAAALDTTPAFFVRAICIFAIGLGKVVVEIKAAIQTGSERVAVENHGSYESRSLITAFLQQLRRG